MAQAVGSEEADVDELGSGTPLKVFGTEGFAVVAAQGVLVGVFDSTKASAAPYAVLVRDIGERAAVVAQRVGSPRCWRV